MSVLITGATGYIGGSILSTLLASQQEPIKNITISAIIRSKQQAEVLEKQGVKTILFRDLDDSDALQKAASEHDVVIHTASGFHTGSAIALITGLGERRKKIQKDVYYIHTSGTSNLGDRPITKTYTENRIFSDTEDIYSYLKSRESKEVYPQRTTDLAVVETGRKLNVKTYIIMSPTIYGIGTGLFNKLSIQIPTITRVALKSGHVQVIEKGDGRWDHVHIADLVLLYELILKNALNGNDIPSGEKGIYFSGTGVHKWIDVSQGIANAGHALGKLKAEVKSVSLEECEFSENKGFLELGMASNSLTRAELGRGLGWNPLKTEDDWNATFKIELEEILKS